MFKYLEQIWKSKDLRKKILFTLGIVVIYRLIAHITVPGADPTGLQEFASRNELLNVFSILTGGSTENLSIVLMGISPYINASIIIQLLTVVVPKFENLSKEGEQGRRKLNSYTRWLTLPLAFFQSYGMLILLNSQSQIEIIKDINNPTHIIPTMLTITAGTLLLVWLGEQISERGIGNGVSILIFISIVSNIPQIIGPSLILAQKDESRLIPLAVGVLVTIILLVVVILINEGARRIPITYAGRGIRARSDQSFLPIRLNQVGMIPIIFAVAMVSFPGILGQFLINAKSEWLKSFSGFLTTVFQPSTVTYFITFFLLIILFSFFYTSITFKPDEVADNIQKRGGYIPGIRPGQQTADYLAHISNRLTFFGGLFVSFVATLPLLTQFFFKSTGIGTVPLLLSGSGMIIIVGVVLELLRQVNAQLQMHDYQKFY
ncbi:MAG: preprotein translocase subunit SecY [Candidatus Gracilibacteria bacterium]|jgi:preprotein translocase subunit SecY